MVHSPLILQGGQLQKNSTSTPEVCKHTYTAAHAPSFPFSHSPNTTYTHTQQTLVYTLLLFHMHVRTQTVKFQLTSAFNVLALSPLFPAFLFSLCFPICCAYLYVLYSCFPPLSGSPLSAKLVSERCLCWIVIKQPSDSAEGLYTNDAIEIQLSALFVTQAELKWGVSGGQTSSQWLYANSQKSGYARL